jgi:hypothetical protein
MRFALIASIAVTLFAPVGMAQAENAKGFLEQSTGKQIHTRYPGDKGYAFGTTQRDLNGPEQPYVERCTWSMEAPIFGGFTQTCERYTTENLDQ